MKKILNITVIFVMYNLKFIDFLHSYFLDLIQIIPIIHQVRSYDFV